jgi:hypothetical protein
MGLPWIRLDTTIFDHPKFLALFATNDYRAAIVHLGGMAYSGRHGTGGYLPREVLPKIDGRARDAKRLVDEGLWVETTGGWDIKGWDEYQVSDDDAKARRDKARRAADARWHKPGDGAA